MGSVLVKSLDLLALIRAEECLFFEKSERRDVGTRGIETSFDKSHWESGNSGPSLGR